MTAGEGHGFRQAANVRIATYGTYYFIAKVLGIEPDVGDDVIKRVVIENLKSKQH